MHTCKRQTNLAGQCDGEYIYIYSNGDELYKKLAHIVILLGKGVYRHWLPEEGLIEHLREGVAILVSCSAGALLAGMQVTLECKYT